MHSFRSRLGRRRPLFLVALLASAGLTVAGLSGCASTTPHCSTVAACSAAGFTQLGQTVLTPRGAIFVQGSIKNGVLVIDFRDPLSGPSYREFVGRPKLPPHCPGVMITLSPTRRFCYAPTKTALTTNMTEGQLVYAVLFNVPPAEAASEQVVVTRIMSSLA